MLALVALTPVGADARGLGRRNRGAGCRRRRRPPSSLVLFVIALVADLGAGSASGGAVSGAGGRTRATVRRRPSIDEVLAAQAQATLVALPAALAAGAIVQVAVWIAGCVVVAGGRAAAGGRARRGAARRAGAIRASGSAARARSRGAVSAAGCTTSRVGARVPIAGVDEWHAATAVDGARHRRRPIAPHPHLVGARPRLVRRRGRRRRRARAGAPRPPRSLADAGARRRCCCRSRCGWLMRLLAGAPGAMLAAARARPTGSRRPRRAAVHRARRRRGLARGDAAAARAVARAGAARRPLRARDDRRGRAFSAAIRRLGAQHLAEERPSALTQWLYPPPSVGDRASRDGAGCSRRKGRRSRTVRASVPFTSPTTSRALHLPLAARDRSSGCSRTRTCRPDRRGTRT